MLTGTVHRPYENVIMFEQNTLYNYIGGYMTFRESELYVNEYDGEVVAELVFSNPAHRDFTIYIDTVDTQLSSELLCKCASKI